VKLSRENSGFLLRGQLSPKLKAKVARAPDTPEITDGTICSNNAPSGFDGLLEILGKK